MLTWVRRDAVLRGWLWWALLGASATSVVMGAAVWSAVHRSAPVQAPVVLLAAWVSVAAYLGFGRVRTRCGPFHLALPLSARRLWLSHLAATTAGGTVVALAAIGVVLIHVRTVPGTPPGTFLPAYLAAQAVTGVLLGVVLLQWPRPALARIPASRGYVAWAALVLAAVPGLLILVHPLGFAGLLLPLLLALGAGYRTFTALPGAFGLAPREAESAPAARAAVAGATAPAAGGAPARWIVPWAVWRGVSAGGLDWMSYSFVLLFAIALGGGLEPLSEDTADLRFLYIPMMAYILFSFMGPRLARLHHLDPLPLPRRALFAVLVVPHFLVFCAGYGLGALGADRVARSAELVSYRQTEAAWRVYVPLRACEIAWDGRVPETVAPWGESHGPVTASPLWRGGRAVLYSPYGTPDGSSRDFVALQLSRALEAVYGTRVPAGEISERCLATNADGVVVAREPGLSLRRAFPGLTPRGGGRMLPVMVTLACVPWLLFTALLLRGYRPGVPERARQAVLWGLAVVVVVAFLGVAAATVGGLMRPWLFRVLVEIPVRALGGSPTATLAVWAGAAVSVFLAYRLAERQFARMEIPTRPTKYTLIEFAREEG